MKFGIIFDCDGTLIDSEHTHYLSWHDALQKRGAFFAKEEYAFFVGMSAHAISKHLCERFAIDCPKTLYEDKEKFFAEKEKHGMPIERTVRLIHELFREKEKLQIQFAVASAASKEDILINLRRLGLSSIFEIVVSGRDDLSDYQDPEGVNKPKPYIYLHTAKLLGLKPSHCIAFEDSSTGVMAAASAGVKTIAVPNSFTIHHDFSLAHEIIPPHAPISVQKIRGYLSNF